MDKKRVLLISANTEFSPYPVYPLALPRLAAALKSRGYPVSQYDMLSGSIPELELKIKREKPGIIGLSLRNIDNIDSCTQKSYISGYAALISRIKICSKAPVVLGGSGFSIFPEELMAGLGADYGITGRGEEALCGLVDCVSEERNPRGLKYLYLRTNDGKARSPVTRPGAVVNPAEHEKEILRYYRRHAGMIGIQTKSGCPLNCVYCTYPLIEGRKTRFFETGFVADEIDRLRKDFGVEYIFFVDSVFNMGRERELELAETLIKRKTGVHWGAFFSPSGIDGKYLKTLKRSGLTHMELGSDSFSDSVLAAYGKSFRYGDILKTSREAFKSGIPAAHYLIFGGPGESAATIKETFNRAREHRLTVFFAALGIRVYPGTEMARMARAESPVSQPECGLAPVFYFAPGLTGKFLEQVIRKETGNAANWVLPGDEMKNSKAMLRLRELGKSGPLWEYLCR